MSKENREITRLESLLDSAVDAIITINKSGIIESVNRSASVLFGYEPGEFVGRNVSFLMPEPWASEHDGYLERYSRTKEPRIIGFGRQVVGLRKDGATFPMHISVSEYFVDGERYHTGIIHDLTARRNAENALFRAQKMEAVGQLTGGIAHDFNNLLTIITGNLELLERQLGDETQLDLLHEALEAANIGADLTNRLLAFARKSILEPVSLDINSMIGDVALLLKRTIGPNIKLHTSLMGGLWSAVADPGQLESALLNLAVNARDAMSDGGELVIATSNEIIDESYAEQEIGLSAGDYIRISVTDSGHGMARETLQKAFDPFFTTKEQGKGTGLGLSMVYGFAKQSGGHVTIYSEEGIGSTINLYLPRQHTGSITNTSRRKAVKTVSLPHGREKILVVEDEPRVRKLTAKRLAALGYSVLSAADGESAKKVLGENSEISLVFTDLIMPGGVSGYQLAEHVTSNYPGVRVLLTSGFAEDLVHGDRLSESKIRLLRKPYSQVNLASEIRAVLDT